MVFRTLWNTFRRKDTLQYCLVIASSGFYCIDDRLSNYFTLLLVVRTNRELVTQPRHIMSFVSVYLCYCVGADAPRWHSSTQVLVFITHEVLIGDVTCNLYGVFVDSSSNLQVMHALLGAWTCDLCLRHMTWVFIYIICAGLLLDLLGCIYVTELHEQPLLLFACLTRSLRMPTRRASREGQGRAVRRRAVDLMQMLTRRWWS